MIILNYSATDPESIIASTSVAASPTLTCVGSYRVRTATTFEPASTYAAISNTAVDLVPTPASSGVSHIVDSLVVFNPDNITHTVIIQWFDGTNAATLWYGTLQAGESVQYAEGTGWQKINANGDPILIGSATTPVLNNRYVLSGALYETFDRNLCYEVNTSLLSTGRLSLQAIYIPSGTVVSSISFWSGTTAAGTPTNQLFGLFDSSRNLLRSSVNDTTTAWAANSKKTLALTSTFTTTYSGIHYLGLMVTATTVPTIKGNTAKTNGALNAAEPSMGGTSTTGLTTALPATAAAPATVTTSFWGCIS
jgi:hypothetical protein